ncbi:MAG: 7-cyano-7-deazaguanine synthase QueC [Armatimonadota bacterium]|nr:7-cyano-7-deazaguanine synthase QueC [Armatimonadota bacterium]
MQKRLAVSLLSGGLDSTTATAMAQRDGFDVAALTVDYGQRHAVEIDAARRVAASLGIERHVVLPLDLRAFGGSALTDDIEVPKALHPPAPSSRKRMEGEDIPVTYVPARNTVFLSLALAWAEAMGSRDIFIGVNALDYSGYPDCRPEFIDAFVSLANLGTKAGAEGGRFHIHAPLIHLTKAEIVRLAISLGLDLGMTTSCYDPGPKGEPCGGCDSCRLRAKGFAGAGVEDPRVR